MEVTAQWVRTYWTKQSRGEPGATRRNAVPQGFLLPEAAQPLVHEVTIREKEGFVPVEQMRREPSDPAEVEAVRDSDLVRVRICPTGFGGPWVYSLQTLNLAHGPATPEIFLGRPDRVVDELAHLR
ncbi:hypothetical protein ABT256_17265 [Amycolatopsis japonica]|uniref:hypothetical protein n=1 Tax=Amycolatopsis japonica TaxID=208439 RepID=UPI00332DBD9C